MQDLTTDFHPEFAAAEQPFITHFDIDANCYNMAKGPDCGRKWYEAHDNKPFVSIDDVSEELLHPSILHFVNGDDDSYFDESAATIGAVRVYHDRYTLMAIRCSLLSRKKANHPEVTDEVTEDHPQKEVVRRELPQKSRRKKKAFGNWPGELFMPEPVADPRDNDESPPYVGWGKNRSTTIHYR